MREHSFYDKMAFSLFGSGICFMLNMFIIVIGLEMFGSKIKPDVVLKHLNQTETFFQATKFPISPESIKIYGGFQVPAWKEYSEFNCSIKNYTPAFLGTFADLCDKSSYQEFLSLKTCSYIDGSCECFNEKLNKIYTTFYAKNCSPSAFRGKYAYEIDYISQCNGIMPVGSNLKKGFILIMTLLYYNFLIVVSLWIVSVISILIYHFNKL